MTSAAPTLDTTFHALASPVRRAVVERLGRGPATVTELAEPFDLALPTLLQHLRVLEKGGVVASHKRGRVRTYRIRPERLRRAASWLEKQREVWEKRLDQLDSYAMYLENSDD
ncbi:MAG: winged helix-turn-helix transcriptional regulator [Planctomycetes bacterium]|nr:winged helix-turn-helix transcriptional regulator [Planctomycetota bacterium]